MIVNAAAYTAVDRAESEPERARAINGIAPGVLAREAARNNAALIHVSTDYVFDGTGDRPWTEADRPAPQSVYGRTKLAGEEAIAAAGAAHAILRTSWLYGRGPNFVRTMLRLGAEREILSVVDDQIGAPTWARPLAQAIDGILSAVAGDPIEGLARRGGLFHACCGGAVSWHGFAEEIFRKSTRTLAVREVRKVTSAEYRAAAPRPMNSRLDCAKLEREFGVRLPEWADALETYLREEEDGRSG